MRIKQSAVAGTFYPGSGDELALMVSQLLEKNPQQGCRPVALQVPHAGLIYSGGVAARAYNRIRPYLKEYSRVVLLGPAHRVPLQGAVVMSSDQWQTPLGNVALDRTFSEELINEGLVNVYDIAHEQEHCLEVQLPFLQVLNGGSEVLPVLVGQTSTAEVAELISRILQEPATLLLISSDLSHFHPYDEAQRIDQQTIRHICQLHSDLRPQQACGCYALNGLLKYAADNGLQAELLGYCNSGDSSGDYSRVVGYSAYAFY